MRIFENRINTKLFVEIPQKMNVIIGNYDNNGEKYENTPGTFYLDNSTKIKIIPSYDGKRFKIEPTTGYKTLGNVELSVEHNRVIKFKNSVIGMYAVGDKIYFKNNGSACSIKETSGESYYIYTIDDPDDPRNAGLISDPLKEIVVKSPIVTNHAGQTAYCYEEFDIPEWIEKDAIISFEFVGSTIEFDTVYTEEDGDVLVREYRDVMVNNIGKIISVSKNPINTFFEVDIDSGVYDNTKSYTISRYGQQNNTGVLYKNEYGIKVNFSLSSINNGSFVKCSKFKVENGGLLIYDKLKEITAGTVTYSADEEIFLGKNTKFTEDYSVGECFIIDGYDDIVFTVKEIINNYRLRIESRTIGFEIEDKYMYRTNKKIDSSESIIYGVYDDYDNNAQGNFKNIMSIRGNRVIYYKFGAYECSIRNNKGNIFNVDFNHELYSIYKVWLNGRYLDEKSYKINRENQTIEVNPDVPDLRRYNNYMYIIYYRNEQNDSDYAFLEYVGYKTSFPSREEYLNELKEFKYYINFSESQGYNYYEYENKILDSTNRILIDKRHNLSFSSYITNDSTSISDVVTNDLVYTTGINSKFRIIRYNYETKVFYVYNDCEIVNPPSDSVNDDVNIITYSVNYKDKITIGSRQFGEGDWGRFELFGLKILSID